MFEVWLGSLALDLYPDTQIAFEESNPMFKAAGELGKNFSYPFKFPNTDHNAQALEFAHVVGVVRNSKSYAVDIKYNGVIFAAGELVLLSRTPEDFEASVQVKRRLPWAYDRKMSELYEVGYMCMPESPVQMVALVPLMDSNDAISLSINGVIFTSIVGTPLSKLQNLEIQINDRLLDTQGVFASVYAPAHRLILHRANPTSDFIIYWLPSSKGSFAGYDTYADSDSVSHAFYAFANTINSNPDDYDFCYPQIINGGKKQDELIGTNEIASDRFSVLNHHNGTEYTPSADTKTNAFCAQLKVGKTIEKICQKFGWKLQSEWLATTAKNLCIFTNHTVYQYVYTAPAGKQWIEYYWLYAHKLPDISLAEFLNELQKTFFLYVNFDFSEDKLIIEPLQIMLKNANTQLVTHFSEKYSLGKESTKAFRYEYELPSNLKKIAEDYFYQFSYDGTGLGETVIKSKMPFVPTLGKGDRRGANQQLFAEQLFLIGKLTERDRPKLLFLFEKKGNTPTGTYYNDLINLQWKSGGISFNTIIGENGEEQGWEEVVLQDRGLYAIYGQEWDKLMRTSIEVERTLYLTTAELLSFQKTNLWRIDNANYFLVRLNYTLKNERVDRHEVKTILRIYNGISVGEYTSGGGTSGGSGGGSGVDPPPLKRRNVLFEFFKNCISRDLNVEFYEGCAPMYTITINVGTCE